MGMRARMPGNGTRQRMWMRFRMQFFSQADSRWKYVSRAARRRGSRPGSARFAFKETGYEFTFDPPARGSTFMLRGVVDFEWRQRAQQGPARS